MAVPDMIRSVAAWIILQCVVRDGMSMGGFVTFGFASLTRYILDLRNDLMAPFPSSSSYLTITVSGSARLFGPGDNDPSIALALMGIQDEQLRKLAPSSTSYLLHDADKLLWHIAATMMTRGGDVAWWHNLRSKELDNSAYECDAALGSPGAFDCTQIEWQQLSPDSDQLEVGPEQVFFLHSKTCFVSVSATVALVLSWEQIRVALATLLSTCVQNPYNPPGGGRAYYLPQTIRASDRKEKRQHSQNSITGLNAIPIHVNLTLFKQTEAWISAAKELDTCTWKAVLNRKPVSICNGS